MPSLSKIPQNANKYATKCAFMVCNEPLECGKGFSIAKGKISAESQTFIGTKNRLFINFEKIPKDIFVHNHPVDNVALSTMDITAALTQNIKKIFASTSSGFTAMDFTTAKKSVSSKQMIDYIAGAEKEIEKYGTELLEPYKKEGSMFLTITKEETAEMNQKFTQMAYNKLKDFAKWSGATFSDVKWNDYGRPKKSNL